jgi:hypothetical protein
MPLDLMSCERIGGRLFHMCRVTPGLARSHWSAPVRPTSHATNALQSLWLWRAKCRTAARPTADGQQAQARQTDARRVVACELASSASWCPGNLEGVCIASRNMVALTLGLASPTSRTSAGSSAHSTKPKHPSGKRRRCRECERRDTHARSSAYGQSRTGRNSTLLAADAHAPGCRSNEGGHLRRKRMASPREPLRNDGR